MYSRGCLLILPSFSFLSLFFFSSAMSNSCEIHWNIVFLTNLCTCLWVDHFFLLLLSSSSSLSLPFFLSSPLPHLWTQPEQHIKTQHLTRDTSTFTNFLYVAKSLMCALQGQRTHRHLWHELVPRVCAASPPQQEEGGHAGCPGFWPLHAGLQGTHRWQVLFSVSSSKSLLWSAMWPQLLWCNEITVDPHYFQGLCTELLRQIRQICE